MKRRGLGRIKERLGKKPQQEVAEISEPVEAESIRVVPPEFPRNVERDRVVSDARNKIKDSGEKLKAYSREVREAEANGAGELPTALARLVIENHNQTMMKSQVVQLGHLPKEKVPEAVVPLSEETMQKQTDILAQNPRFKEKCEEIYQNPQKLEPLLSDRAQSRSVLEETSQNLTNFTRELNPGTPQPEVQQKRAPQLEAPKTELPQQTAPQPEVPQRI